MKIRIGVLIKEFSKLEDWELVLFKKILNSNNLELCLLIKDGTTSKPKKESFIKKITRKNSLNNFILKKQYLLESKLENIKKKNINGVEESLDKIDSVFVKPINKDGKVDSFSSKDLDHIKKYNLDVILKHEFDAIKGDILNISKYGIWNFNYSINKIGSVGLWQVILNKPVIGVSLQKLTSDLRSNLLIDKAFYSTFKSFYYNEQSVYVNSIDLIFKNFKKIEQGSFIDNELSSCEEPEFKTPNLLFVLKYLWIFYKSYLLKVRNLVFKKFFGKFHYRWTLFLGKGDFLENSLKNMEPVKLPKGEFWADPFIFSFEGEEYVFFENYPYSTYRGKISCGKIKGNDLIDVKDVFDTDYHMSYPFVFEENNEIFMIPECSENKRVEVYICNNFPDDWSLYSTAFEGETIADVTYFVDDENNKWLFLNKDEDGNRETNGRLNTNLYIYKIDSLKFNKIEEHKLNPVIIDSRKARNAGPIFKRDDKFIRPSQNNSYGKYGFALNVSTIDELSIDRYSETNIKSIQPSIYRGLIGTHHLHQYKNSFVIDGAYDLN